MSKNIEPRQYTQWEVEEQVAGLVAAYHKTLAFTEKTFNKRFYEKFGEWKKLNPNNPVAKKNYPDNEYVLVISAYKKYFDMLAERATQDATTYELDL